MAQSKNKILKSEKIVKDQLVIIPLRFKSCPSYKRAPRAISAIKIYIYRHFIRIIERVILQNISLKIDCSINRYLWKNGAKNIPKKIKILVNRRDNLIVCSLFTNKSFD